MKNLLAIAGLLSALGASGTSLAAGAACAWKEPADKPSLKVDEGVVMFKHKVDAAWFKCAKKAGGTATLQFLVGPEGKLVAKPEKKLTSSVIQEGAYNNDFCSDRPLPDRIQVTVVGTGAMEKLSFTSEVLPVHCARCQFVGYDNSLALHIKSFSTPQGMVTLEGTMDEKWLACAKEGSTLEARFYLGQSHEEVKRATQATFVLKGLEASQHFKKAFPEKQMCEGGATWIGVELFGTGEMADMSGRGRSISETRCK